MKKYLFFAAAVAITACTNDTLIDDTKVPDTKEVAIGFATGTNNLTRAENSSATKTSALETYHQNFSVWGYKNIKDGSATLQATKVFNGTIANGTALSGQIAWVEDTDPTKSDWKYAPTRYWDKTATNYDFYAAAPTKDFAATPASIGWVLNEVTGASGTPTVTELQAEHGRYFTLAGVEIKGESLPLATTTDTEKKVTGQTDDVFGKGTTNKDVDLMIATNIISYKNYTKDRVHFFFNHILSRLNIGVKTTVKYVETTDEQSLILKAVKVYNMYSKGNFDESKAGIATDPKLADGTVARWVDATSGSVSPSQQTTVFGFPNDEVKLKISTDKFDIAKELTYTKGTGTSSTDATAKWEDYKLVYQGLVIPQTVAYDGGLLLDGSNAVAADGSVTASAPYLYIEYELNGETYKSYYNLAALFNGSMLAYTTANGYKAYKTDKTETDGTYAFKKDEDFVDYTENGISGYGFKCSDGTFYAANKQEIEKNTTDNKWYYKGTDNEVTEPTTWILWDEYHNLIPVTNAEVSSVEKKNVDFCEGWQNNLWITINPTSIQFDADVYEWSTKWDSGVTVE